MRTGLSVLACSVAAIVTLAGRQGQPPRDPQDTVPVFRSGANLIRVDMYPTTRDGQFVSDLRPEDIELYEDGVRQNIETFEFVRIGGSATSTPVNQEDSRTRIFVVFVDTNTAELAGDGDLRRAVLRFLDRTVQPTDLVGLMTPDMSPFNVTLGRKASVISDVANDARWIDERPANANDPKGFQWENCYSTGRRLSRRVTEMKARRNARDTLDALGGLVARLRDLREERKAVLLVTGGWPFNEESSLTNGSDNETKSCAEDRKALLRINYGNLLKDLARTANRANVSFYPVSSRPLMAIPRDLPAQMKNEMRRRELRVEDQVGDQLRELAETTDGLWESQVRNMDKVTDRIISDTSAYYLLGYQSSNVRADSKFRGITVKVNRPGVTVRSRPGYGAETTRLVKLGTPPARPLMDSRVLTAFEGVQRFEPANPVWLRTSAFTASMASAEGGAFWVVGEAGSRTERLDGSAEVIVTAADKRQVFTSRIDVRGTADLFDMRVPATGTLPFGNYSVRVRIHRAGAESTSPLVQDFPRVELVASVAGLSEPVLSRRGPLVRDSYRHTADPRFRRTERLRLEYATDVDGIPTARVLDRMGQPLPVPVQVEMRNADDGAIRWAVADLALTGLAPGDYAVSMSQGETTQITAFRVVP